MNADQIAQKFFESGYTDSILTKKQTAWLFSKTNHSNFNGQFSSNGISYVWYASKKGLRYGVSRFEVMEAKKPEQEEKHPLQVFMESKGFSKVSDFMNAPNYLDLMDEFYSTFDFKS